MPSAWEWIAPWRTICEIRGERLADLTSATQALSIFSWSTMCGLRSKQTAERYHCMRLLSSVPLAGRASYYHQQLKGAPQGEADCWEGVIIGGFCSNFVPQEPFSSWKFPWQSPQSQVDGTHLYYSSRTTFYSAAPRWSCKQIVECSRMPIAKRQVLAISVLF